MRQLLQKQHQVAAPVSLVSPRQPVIESAQGVGAGHDLASIRVDAGHDFASIRVDGPPSATDFVSDHAFYELLAHNVAYRTDLPNRYLYRCAPSCTPNLPDGFALGDELPLLWPSANLPTVYLIEQVSGSDPENEKLGLAAFTLTPVTRDDAPQILLFRGTEPALADIIADADPGGVGSASFEALRKSLFSTTACLAAGRGPVVVTGHSLGGALAQLAAAMLPEVVGECVTFNSPGIGVRALREFTGGVSAVGAVPKVTHYITRGDVVSTVGEARLPGETVMFDTPATRDLAAFYNNERSIELASAGIAHLQKAMGLLSLSGATLPLVLVRALTMGGEIEELKYLGCTLGALHTALPLQGSVPLGRTGSQGGTFQSYPPTERTRIPLHEEARRSLGQALNSGLGNLATLLPNLMISLDPLSEIADVLEPIIDALADAIKKAGGLKALLGALLYVDPTTRQMEYWMKEVPVTPQEESRRTPPLPQDRSSP